MKKLYTTLLLALLSLTISAQTYNFDAPVRFNSWLTMAKNHPGTHANRLIGISSAGAGVNGSFVNYIYLSPELLINDSLIIPGVSPGHGGPYWKTTGNENTIFPNNYCGTSDSVPFALGCNNKLRGGFTPGGFFGLSSDLVQGASTYNFIGGDTSHLELSTHVGGTTTGILHMDKTTGNVGIGTSSPAYKLEVVGGAALRTYSDDGVGNTLELNVQSNGYSSVHLLADGSFTLIKQNLNGFAFFGAHSATANDLFFLSNGDRATIGTSSAPLSGDDYLTVLASGNVGIGTNAPAAILDVTSSNSGIIVPRLNSIDVTTPVNGMIIYNPATDKFQGYADGIWVDLN
jgi:hypothetical protein